MPRRALQELVGPPSGVETAVLVATRGGQERTPALATKLQVPSSLLLGEIMMLPIVLRLLRPPRLQPEAALPRN